MIERDEFINKRAEGFDQMLAMESSQNFVWQTRMEGKQCLDLPLWLPIRYMVARAIEDTITGSINFDSYHMPITLPSPIYLWRSLQSLRHLWQKSAMDILNISTDIGVIQQNGQNFNRLADYFSLCYPQNTRKWQIALRFKDYSRSAVPFVENYEFSRIKNILALPRMVMHNRRVRSAVMDFIEKIKAFIKLDESYWDEISQFLYKFYISQPIYTRLLARMLENAQPKMILLEDGCYGYHAPLICLAKKMGIKSAEYQHGMISVNHEAYNYHPHNFSTIAPYLPDYFLSYGAWWHQQMSIPSQIVPVGSAHYSESMRFIKPQIQNRTVLFISSGMQPQLYQQIIKDFLHRAPDYQLLFRRHPLERYEYKDLLSIKGFSMDNNSNFYDSLNKVDAVFGDISTGLFEAYGLGKRVFVIDSQLTRRHIPEFFTIIETGSQLVQSLAIADESPRNELFCPNWQENYRAFIANSIRSKVA